MPQVFSAVMLLLPTKKGTERIRAVGGYVHTGGQSTGIIAWSLEPPPAVLNGGQYPDLQTFQQLPNYVLSQKFNVAYPIRPGIPQCGPKSGPQNEILNNGGGSRHVRPETSPRAPWVVQRTSILLQEPVRSLGVLTAR